VIYFGDRPARNSVFSAKIAVITKFGSHVGALRPSAPTNPKSPYDNPPGGREFGQQGLRELIQNYVSGNFSKKMYD
jgi:hypothetical protein